MEGGGGGLGVLSRSHEDLSRFNNSGPQDDGDDDDDADLLFPECGVTSSAPSPLHGVDSVWDESTSAECFPLEMERAVSAAMATGTLTPLLKEELRCKIQLQRLQRGKDEMTPDFSVKHSEMSTDEVVKKNKKMQQNRQSAQRSRDRRKSSEKTIKTKLDQLNMDNKLLESQATSLRHACHLARQWLHEHRDCLEKSQKVKVISAARFLPAATAASCVQLPSGCSRQVSQPGKKISLLHAGYSGLLRQNTGKPSDASSSRVKISSSGLSLLPSSDVSSRHRSESSSTESSGHSLGSVSPSSSSISSSISLTPLASRPVAPSICVD